MKIGKYTFYNLFFLLAIAASQQLFAASKIDVEKLINKAQSTGSIRVIVNLKTIKLPDQRFTSQKSFDRALKHAAVNAQSAVLGRLPAGALVGEAKKFPYTSQFVANVAPSGLLAMMNDPSVISIQEDTLSHPFLEQSVPYIFSGNDSSAYSGKGFAVAIIDTGVDKLHTFLTGKVVSEACYSTNLAAQFSASACPGSVESTTITGSGMPCNLAYEGCDHGTHVAGIAAGFSSDDFHGVAKDADIIAIQVFSLFSSSQQACKGVPCVLSWASDQLFALQRVYELSASLNIASVNMSLGGGYETGFCDGDFRKPTIDLLRSAGIATVVASGNNGFTNGVSSPACISSAITVGATNDLVDTTAMFSNSGPQLDVYAPGVSVISSVPGGGFQSKNGTSMATPHVSAAWAILRQKVPAASVDEIETILKSTGVTVTSNGISAQRIDIDMVVNALNVAGSGFFALKSLGELYGDNIQGSAVVSQTDVTVKKLDSSTVNQFGFSSDLIPVDVEVMQDINNNGAPEMVLLGENPARAEVVDSVTGELLGTAIFSAKARPIDLEILPDQNGNLIPELAVLEKQDNGATRVEIRDILNNMLIKNVFFNPNSSPRDLAILPSVGGTTAPDLAVLQEVADPLKSDRVEIRDLESKQRVRNVWFGRGFEVKQLVVLEDMNNNGTPELAVLREGSVNVLVKDAGTDQLISRVGFSSYLTTQKMLVVPDIGNDGTQGLGLMLRHPVSGKVKIEIRDVSSGQLSSELWYGNKELPLDAVVYPDINGNGFAEIGMLSRNIINQDRLLLRIKDASSGAHVKAVLF
ncbi:MAG: S8 family peptidase [Arenicellales bacterium]